MSVISRGTKIHKMTYPHQYFDVGEVFLYTPLDMPDSTIKVKVIQNHNCTMCSLIIHCGRLKNSIYNAETGKYDSFIPCCAKIQRPDGNSVIFKEI